MKVVGGLVVGEGLKAAMGRSDKAGKQRAEVLALAYAPILVGVLESDSGRRFRSAHPDLFRNGRVKDLEACLQRMDSPAASHGGPTDDVLRRAETALDRLRIAMAA